MSHSVLRDRYARRALLLDVLILMASAWLTAMAFVDPEIAKQFAFPGVTSVVTIGLIGTLTFMLAILQLKVDWKARADRHNQAAGLYAQAKLRFGELNNSEVNDQEFHAALSSYRSLGDVCVPVPESQFNSLKKKHVIKVAISTEISRNPGASILLIRLRFWIMHNVRMFRGAAENEARSTRKTYACASGESNML